WDVVPAVTAARPSDCILLECLTLWLTNLMLGLPGRPAKDDAAILTEVTALVEAARTRPGRAIVVSNEVGWGIIPADALARRFGDVLGEANQRLAAVASEVYGCMAGIPWRLK